MRTFSFKIVFADHYAFSFVAIYIYIKLIVIFQLGFTFFPFLPNEFTSSVICF